MNLLTLAQLRVDVLFNTNKGPAYLDRNDSGNRNHWLQLKLIGTKSNRSAAARHTVADGPQRIELPLGQRSGADLRVGEG